MARLIHQRFETDERTALSAPPAHRAVTPLSIAHVALVESLQCADRLHFIVGDGALFTGPVSVWNPSPPRASALSFLRAVADRPNTRVTLVSGRLSWEVERHFSDFGVRCYSEHGARYAATPFEWNTRLPAPVAWRERVGAALLPVSRSQRRTLLEERPNAFLLLCNAFDASVQSRWVSSVRSQLTVIGLAADCRIESLRDAVEVRPRSHSKSVALLDALSERQSGELVVVIAGPSDEDLLEPAGPTCVVIQLGASTGRTPWVFSSPDELLHLLSAIAV